MIDITTEPTGSIYRDLLDYLARSSASFSLVRRHDCDFSPSADIVEEQLRPFRIRQERTNKWPGTELMSDFATVTFYKVTTEAIGIISQMGALYRWLSPDYPEDLAFYREDGSCLFASISHERDAWFEGELSVNEIREHLPGLMVKEHHFHS